MRNVYYGTKDDANFGRRHDDRLVELFDEAARVGVPDSDLEYVLEVLEDAGVHEAHSELRKLVDEYAETKKILDLCELAADVACDDMDLDELDAYMFANAK